MTAETASLTKVAEADFPTEYGQFRIFGFEMRAPAREGFEMRTPAREGFEMREGSRKEEAVVLTMGNITEGPPPLVRIHSQCLTGDVFHSLRCDCRAQLEIALREVGLDRRGLIIYEHQEGRGIGLMNKLRAYELQDRGADTVEANEQLGFESDLRAYAMPGAILRYFGIGAVRLMSNNPDKVRALEDAGVQVTERVPCIAAPQETRERYLRTKQEKMGHLLDL